jgi:hypothetical protein
MVERKSTSLPQARMSSAQPATAGVLLGTQKVNTRSSNRLQFRIFGGSALCEAVRSRGFESFESLTKHVRSLPYGTEIKVKLHKDAIAVWAKDRGISEELAWATREACIAALAERSAIERVSSL